LALLYNNVAKGTIFDALGNLARLDGTRFFVF
jgi:hypothetical protein